MRSPRFGNPTVMREHVTAADTILDLAAWRATFVMRCARCATRPALP